MTVFILAVMMVLFYSIYATIKKKNTMKLNLMLLVSSLSIVMLSSYFVNAADGKMKEEEVQKQEKEDNDQSKKNESEKEKLKEERAEQVKEQQVQTERKKQKESQSPAETIQSLVDTLNNLTEFTIIEGYELKESGYSVINLNREMVSVDKIKLLGFINNLNIVMVNAVDKVGYSQFKYFVGDVCIAKNSSGDPYSVKLEDN